MAESDKQDFIEFFKTARLIYISQAIVEQAVELRQKRKISLGDSIIAATAIVNDLTLITANIADFKWISNIKLLNPLTEDS